MPVVQVEGADQLARTLGLASRDLDDLKQVHKMIADLVVTVSRPNTPRGDTGRLAKSGRGRGNKGSAVVRFGVPYSAVIHYGWPARRIRPRPFAWDAVEAIAPQRDAAYVGAFNRILSRVKGV